MGLVGDTETAWRFFEGDQWYGLESGERLPVYNIIAPSLRYRVANIAMNDMQIYYTPLSSDERTEALARRLNVTAAAWWDRLRMDGVCWKMLKDSVVAGESYLYIYDEDGNCQVLDNTGVFLGDEEQPDIQRQPYIILLERRDAAEVRQSARAMGLPEEQVRLIQPDSAAKKVTTAKGGEESGKVTCLLYMRKEGQDVYFVRTTRNVVLGEEKCIRGLGCYPLISLVSGRKKGSARGRGEVLPMIANQIEINRNLVRRIVNAKLTAFSRLVYATDKIDNPQDLDQVGSAIAVNDSTVADIHSAVGYISPAPMSGDAKAISDEMISLTRELAGAGSALLGNIDPSTASGAAIIAVRDQAQVPLNENAAAFRRFVEEVAGVWLRLWICYQRGVFDEGDFTVAELVALRPRIRVDATSTTPFSKYAREQALDKLLEGGHITLEEYADALDDGSSVPKAKLTDILRKRKEKMYENVEGNGVFLAQ